MQVLCPLNGNIRGACYTSSYQSNVLEGSLMLLFFKTKNISGKTSMGEPRSDKIALIQHTVLLIFLKKLKKALMKNFIFCTVNIPPYLIVFSLIYILESIESKTLTQNPTGY